MDIKIIYEDNDLLVIEKPAGIIVFPENSEVSDTSPLTLVDLLIQKYPCLKNVGETPTLSGAGPLSGPPRYGIVHRLDKDTSGVLLVAKTPEALIFLQKQFSAHTFSSIKSFEEGKSGDETSPQRGGKNVKSLENILEKRYIALVTGSIKEDSGVIETLIGRSPMDPRKQRAYSQDENAPASAREAITDYKVIERLTGYTLLEVNMKTGRKHQIRCHLAHIHHPIAGDKLYGFKDSPKPEGLERQFLHAGYLKIQLLNGEIKEFRSDLPQDLQLIVKNLKIKIQN